MPLGVAFLRRLSIVDNGHKSVSLVRNIKDDVAFYRIGILERSADLIKTVPANHLDNGDPGLDFVRYIWVGFHRLPQVLTCNDMHSVRVLHNL